MRSKRCLVQKRVGPDKCLLLMEHFLLSTSVIHKLKKIDRNLNTKMQSLHGLTNHHLFTMLKALPGFLLCIFSSLTCGRYQPGSIGIFWPAEGTSQNVTISKKWKNPSFPLPRKRTWVQALLASAQISNRGRAYTQALLLYFKHSMCTFPEASYSPLTNSHHFARATTQQARQ